MTYLIIALVLLAIIAPIVRVLPSKEQKDRMVKRRLAMTEGIGVEMIKIEDPDPDPKKYRSSTGKALERELSVVAYRLNRGRGGKKQDIAPWCLLKHASKGRVPFVGDWYWASPGSALVAGELSNHLSAEVAQLPQDVVRIEEKNQFVSLYWHERGEVSEVIDFLKRTILV